MLAYSSLLRDLEQHAFSTLHEPMRMYGDPAYPHRVHLQSPFREAVLTDDMKLFNASMSACSISVEWLFGDVINCFKFLDYKKKFKIGMSNVGKMYVVCAVLRNALTCLYGNQTSEYFPERPIGNFPFTFPNGLIIQISNALKCCEWLFYPVYG